MSWVRNDLGEHEGYAAYVTAVGLTGTSSGVGVLVRREDADERAAAAWAVDRTPTDEDVYHLVPWDGLLGWQVACACGWTGSRWDRATTVPGEYGGYESEDAWVPDQNATVETLAKLEWSDHVGAFDALDAISRAAVEVGEAARRLDEAVQAARAAQPPATWEEIGRAAGMTRQSAHERWGQSEQDGTSRRLGPRTRKGGTA